MIKVFFDASVLFAGFYSPSGASRKLLELTCKKIILGITTQTVIDELADNIIKFPYGEKININALIPFYRLYVRERIQTSELKPHEKMVHPKDAHVVAGAILTKCRYLVTLDQKHLDNPKAKAKISKVKIISPRKLLIKLLSYPKKPKPN